MNYGLIRIVVLHLYWACRLIARKYEIIPEIQNGETFA